MWRVTRQNNLSGDAAGAAEVDPAGGFADADLRAPTAAPQGVVDAIAPFNDDITAWMTAFDREKTIPVVCR
jgi:hypothetical protein